MEQFHLNLTVFLSSAWGQPHGDWHIWTDETLLEEKSNHFYEHRGNPFLFRIYLDMEGIEKITIVELKITSDEGTIYRTTTPKSSSEEDTVLFFYNDININHADCKLHLHCLIEKNNMTLEDVIVIPLKKMTEVDHASLWDLWMGI